MPVVRLSKNINVETRKKLGFDELAHLSLRLGTPYPLADEYFEWSRTKQIIWKAYLIIGEMFINLLFLTNLIDFFVSGHDIKILTLCGGTMSYIVCFRLKQFTYSRKAKVLENVIYSVHKISEELDSNPLKDDDYFPTYFTYLKQMQFFEKSKVRVIIGCGVGYAIFSMINAFFISPEDRSFPMFGWFPYDPSDLLLDELTISFQLLSYLALELRNIVLDLLFITILIAINTQLLYMSKLLNLVVTRNRNGTEFDLYKQEKALGWWIKHHQMILKMIEEFDEIASRFLFYMYISVAFIIILAGFLLTSNADYDRMQQLTVVSVGVANLFQLFVFSIIGDEITGNGLQIVSNAFHYDMVDSTLKKSYMYITLRCSKPILLKFGKITSLSVASFAMIIKTIFSYFLTVKQVRDKAFNKTFYDLELFNLGQNGKPEFIKLENYNCSV